MIPEGEDPIISDPEVITIATRASLSLVKASSVNRINAGETFTYTLHLTNSGPSSAQNIVLSDVLPANVTYVNATNGGSISNGIVSWNLPTLANGSIFSASFTVRVVNSTEAGTIIRNVGTVQAGTANPINSNPVDVIVETDANISLFKIAEQVVVNAGENIVYRINVTNNGPSVARNITVYDMIPEGTTFFSAFADGVFYTDRVVWNIAAMIVGESKTLVMTVKVNSDVAPGTLIRNVAIGSSDDGDDPVESNPVVVPVAVKADLSVEKTGWPKPVNAGNIITYTINIKNNGPSNASGVELKDVLPNYLTLESLITSKGTWNDSILAIGTLVAGETLIVTLKAKVNAGTPEGHEIVNTAIVSSSVFDPDLMNNSSTDRTFVTTMADVSITKSAAAGVVAGTFIQYRINVFNAGPSNAQNIIITDITPSSLSNIEYSRNNGQTWDVWTETHTLETLHAGSIYSILIRGNVNPSATGTIINTVSVETTTDDPNPENNTDTETTPVVIQANVSINKSAPVNVVAGQQLLYTFTLSPGTSDATGVHITDIIPEGISNAQYSIDNGVIWMPWPATNQIAIGTLYAGMPVQLLLRGLVAPTVSGSIMNTVLLETESFDPDVTNNIDSVEVSVIPLADLSIEKTNGQEEYIPGTTVVYTITVSNIGPSALANARVTDTAPAGTTIASWTATGSVGTIFNDSGTGNIDEQVSLPYEGAIVYNVTVIVPMNQQGALQNTAIVAVSGDAIDPNLNNNIATDIDRPTTRAQLLVVKTTTQQEVTAGENAVYTIRLTNQGPNTAYNVVITDTLAEGVTFVGASTGGINYDGVVRWIIPSMNNGTSFVASLIVKVNSDVEEGTVIRNIVVADSDNSDDPKVSDPIDITIINRSVLSIEKIASVTEVDAGELFSYSIRVINNGPSDITNVAVRDTLPGELQFISASGNGTVNSGIVSWNISSIASGSSEEVMLTVRVDSGLAGGTIIRNVAVAQGSPEDEPVPSTPEEVAITRSSTFDIVKEAANSVIAGEILSYTLRVTNTSTITATNVSVSDTLPAGVTLISASANNTFTGNVVSWLLPSLNEGAIREFSIEVFVNATLDDGSLLRNTAWVTAENSDSTYSSNTIVTSVTTLHLVANDDVGTPLIGNVGGITVPNVLINDLYGTVVVTLSEVTITEVSSDSPNISINSQTGQVLVEDNTPAGNYALNYRICLISNPQICDEATVTVTVVAPTIIANDDTGTEIDNYIGGVAVNNVTDNDLLNNEPFDLEEVILTLLVPAAVSGINLDIETGEVTVDAGTPVGTYQITYQICDVVNPGNCDNAVVTITITDVCDMLIPTGFSPNGDGINDQFRISCIERYPNAHIEVYNRWGNLVYKKEKYGNVNVWGDTEAWWDGASTHNWNIGKDKLPPGTYFYLLDLKNGDEKPKTGSIFLNR
jgi:uncharacterized repeat protein (TIGR01451 family)/gliding motility-associated-like protein